MARPPDDGLQRRRPGVDLPATGHQSVSPGSLISPAEHMQRRSERTDGAVGWLLMLIMLGLVAYLVGWAK